MKRFIDIIVVGFSSILISTNAYVNNNNNGNSVVTTTIKNKNNIMDWLPKNAFLPKTNLIQIQEQLIHTVWNIQLDMETIKGVAAMPTATVSTTSTTLDPNQEFIGWNTKNTGNGNMDRNVVKKKPKKDTTIKSSLQQRSSSDETLPRLPIRNLQFMLGKNAEDSVLKAHDESIRSSETSVPSDHSSSGGDVGYSTALSPTTTRTIKVKQNHHPILPMPGYNGPHPLLSSGILPLNILNCGEYVTLHKGIQSLPLSTTTTTATTTTSSDRRDDTFTATLLQPQWEVIWKEQSPTGTIVCGIQLQHSICRNDMAMIPAGMMYISFPIWDGIQLLEYQKKKVQYDITSKLYSQERDNEIEKMTKSNNIFNKLMHYKNAFAAAENYSLQPHKTFKNVPTTLSDLIVIDNNNNNSESNQVPLLYIVPKGMVRIVPTETMQQWTPTTPCGKQQSIMMMNPNLLWSSTSSTSNNYNNNNILHGTAKISNIPSVQQSPSPRTLTTEEGTITTEEGTTTTTSSSSSKLVPLMDDVVSSTNTETDTSFM